MLHLLFHPGHGLGKNSTNTVQIDQETRHQTTCKPYSLSIVIYLYIASKAMRVSSLSYSIRSHLGGRRRSSPRIDVFTFPLCWNIYGAESAGTRLQHPHISLFAFYALPVHFRSLFCIDPTRSYSNRELGRCCALCVDIHRLIINIVGFFIFSTISTISKCKNTL